MRALHFPRRFVDKLWISISKLVDKLISTHFNKHLQNQVYTRHLWIRLYKHAK